MPASLKIGTWNVNGIRARLDQVQDWVRKERPDILCLQEIKASPDQIPMFLCELEDYWCYWHGAKGTPEWACSYAKSSHPNGQPLRIPRSTTRTES